MTRRPAPVAARACAAALAVLCASPLLAQEVEKPREPTAEEVRADLLRKLPPLVLGEDGVERLVVEGIIHPARQRFALHARGDDAYDLLVTSPDDGEPYMVGRDGTTLAYVPADERGRVRLFPGLAQLELRVAEGQMHFGLATVGAEQMEDAKRVGVSVDPASMIQGVTEDVRVARADERRYRLSGATRGGTHVEVDVDLGASYPVRALRITFKDEDTPSIEITRLDVNAERGARIAGIPTVESLREQFDVEDLRGLDDDEVIPRAMGATFESAGTRLRIALLESSHDPAEKARFLRDLRERTTLGDLVRAAAAR